MSAFAMFAAQHEQLLERRRAAPVRPPRHGRVPARPDTPTEIAALEHIRANPGSAASKIALALNIEQDQVYPIMQRLKRNGQIVSTGTVRHSNLWRAVEC